MQPPVVGSSTVQPSPDSEPSELRGAAEAFSVFPPPPAEPASCPWLAAFSAFSAWDFRLAITLSCFCCSLTVASMAALAWACLVRVSFSSRNARSCLTAIVSSVSARSSMLPVDDAVSSAFIGPSRPVRYVCWAISSSAC
jgi:hypothetical protein